MTELLINPQVASRVAKLRETPPESLLLYGPKGVGLLTIARHMAHDKYTLVQPTDKKGETDLEQGTISVAAIRDLYTRVRGKSKASQIVIIDQAESMSHGAQNAFLKLLEEPNQSTKFILTSHDEKSLLPTIRSRTQSLIIPPITPEQTAELLQRLNPNVELKKQLLFLATGLPAEIHRLVQSPKKIKELAVVINDAKTLLASDRYQKLVVVTKYSSKREKAVLLLDCLLRLINYSLTRSQDASMIAKAETVLSTHQDLQLNTNVKLQLLRLVI